MPSRFTSRKISDTEYRLKLLLCVDALGMATREQLWPFVAKLELMEYVPMCLYADELIRDGALALGAYATEGELFLTDEGRAMLKLFRGSIPTSDRERVLKAAKAYVQTLRERRQVSAGYELAPRGRYRCLCTMSEGDLPVVLLRVETGDPAYASMVIRRFKNKATALLMCLYTVRLVVDDLTREWPDAPNPLTAMEAATPDVPVLCGFGKREHAVAVVLPLGDTEYRVALMLPSAEAARAWAVTVIHERAEMAEKLDALLRAKEKPR